MEVKVKVVGKGWVNRPTPQINWRMLKNEEHVRLLKEKVAGEMKEMGEMHHTTANDV